jgi:AAA domain
MSINFVDAEREKLYAKIAIIAASGAGKTVGALKLGYGLTGDWSKIAFADTENKRALAYVGTKHTGLDIGTFKHAPMYAPFKTENFSDAIDAAVKMGAECLIIDSFSHEWEGLGGVTHAAEEAGGDFWHWKGPKIEHRRLVDKIQQSPIHIIVTIRTKQEYAVIPGGGRNGKNAIEKLGMKPVQSNDLDYEFLIAFHLNEDHEAEAKKDNTGLFKQAEFQIEAEHGQMLREWLIEGKEVKSVAEEQAEKAARHEFLVKTFRGKMAENDKANAYFTQLEIKYSRQLEEFPLDTLEDLYAKMNKPKEEKNVSKEEPAEEKTEAGESITEAIYRLADDPTARPLFQDFMKKNKAEEVADLKEDKQKMLLQMLEIRTKKEEVNV